MSAWVAWSASKNPLGFRREAFELVKTSDRPIIEIARSFGITDSTLHNWLKPDRGAKARAEDPNWLSESEIAELKRLREQNIELRTDREILIKAAAYFTRNTTRWAASASSRTTDTYEVRRLSARS